MRSCGFKSHLPQHENPVDIRLQGFFTDKMKNMKGASIMKPLIGILPLWDTERNCYWLTSGYMSGIVEAGGIPMMLPLTTDETLLRQAVELFDGFIISGGHDITPALYGETLSPNCEEIIPDLDSMESFLLSEVFKTEKPIFGICRGMQFINVVLGGSLYQELPSEYESEVTHRMKPPYYNGSHKVKLLPEAPLFHITNCSELRVNSVHHQGVKTLAPQLKAAAVSEDGLVEAVYMPDKPFVMAVQWHPEWALGTQMHSEEIFRAFVSACASYHASKEMK